jgi:hypothetical protein
MEMRHIAQTCALGGSTKLSEGGFVLVSVEERVPIFIGRGAPFCARARYSRRLAPLLRNCSPLHRDAAVRRCDAQDRTNLP